jgi:DNA-binding FadR family transcriptional regulator
MALSKAKKQEAHTAGPEADDDAAVVYPGASAALRRNIKTSETVALDLVRDIVARNLKAGDKLPLEAELLKQYRVSRSSLREALRLLEVQGLITIRPGPGGGTVVGRAQPANLGRTLALHMHMIGATYDELLDTWEMTEAILAERAARNPDRDKVRKLMTPFLDKDSPSHHAVHSIGEGLEFHDKIGELAGNRVLSFLLLIAGTMVGEHIITTVERGSLEDHIVHDHSIIAEAIIAGNAKKAHELMYNHLHHIAEYFREYWPRKVGEKIQWR